MSIPRIDVTKRYTKFDPPEPTKVGELIVWHWHTVQPQSTNRQYVETLHYRVNSVEEAKQLLNELINEEKGNEDIEANAFGLLRSTRNPDPDPISAEFIYEEWESDEDGDDIMEIIRAEEEAKEE